MIFKKYQKYLLRIYVNNLISVSLVFLIISFIISIFEEIKFFETKEVDLYYPIVLTLLNLPSVLYEIWPFIFLIVSIFFFIYLNDRDEIDLLKSNGIDNLQLLKFLSTVSILFGLIIIVFYYTFSSSLKNQYLLFKNKFTGGNEYLAVVNESGLWIKENIENNINIINALKFEGNHLEDLTITQVDTKYKTAKTMISKKADISSKLWLLKDVEVYNYEMQKEKFKTLIYQSSFDGEIISNLFSNLNSLNIYQLHRLSNNYKRIGYSTTEIKIHLNKIYSLPFYLLFMTILGSILMIKLKFIKSKLLILIIGVFASVMVYYLNYFSSLFGSNETIPITLSVWLPVFILSLTCLMGMVKINEI